MIDHCVRKMRSDSSGAAWTMRRRRFLGRYGSRETHPSYRSASRRGGKAKCKDIDVAQRLWRIGDNKGERPHRVPLTELAIEIIDELRILSNARPYLLPSVHSTLKPDTPIRERALSGALRNNHVGEKQPQLFGCEPSRRHDPRRTAATHITGRHRGLRSLQLPEPETTCSRHMGDGISLGHRRHAKQGRADHEGTRIMTITERADTARTAFISGNEIGCAILVNQ